MKTQAYVVPKEKEKWNPHAKVLFDVYFPLKGRICDLDGHHQWAIEIFCLDLLGGVLLS